MALSSLTLLLSLILLFYNSSFDFLYIVHSLLMITGFIGLIIEIRKSKMKTYNKILSIIMSIACIPGSIIYLSYKVIPYELFDVLIKINQILRITIGISAVIFLISYIIDLSISNEEPLGMELNLNAFFKHDELVNEDYSIKELTDRELLIFNQNFNTKSKNQTTAWLLWFFLGGVGAERFYLGERLGIGIAQAIMAGFGIITLGFGYRLTGIPILVIWVLSAVNLNNDLQIVNKKIEQQLLQEIINGNKNTTREKNRTSYNNESNENNEDDNLEVLQKLAKFREQNIITEEEFENKKREILSKI